MSCKVSLVGNFDSKTEWMVERLTLGTKDGGFYGAAASFIRAQEPFMHIANISSKTCYIQQGDVIGILQDPALYLDKPSSMSVSNNVAALANVIHKLSRGTATEKDSLERPLASPDQPPEEPGGPGEDTAWGPKTAKTPEVETWPLEDLETIIDITEDIPPDVQEWAFKLIRQKAQAFSFNDR